MCYKHKASIQHVFQNGVADLFVKLPAVEIENQILFKQKSSNVSYHTWAFFAFESIFVIPSIPYLCLPNIHYIQYIIMPTELSSD